jgi:hypothetical protein
VWATNIPDTPPDTKKKTNVNVNKNGNSIINALLTSVTLQCINFVAAGTEIITVRVLKSIRVVCDKPTIYI